jgi:hypothetical protein
MIREALKHAGGNKSQAARLLASRATHCVTASPKSVSKTTKPSENRKVLDCRILGRQIS